MKIGLNVVEAIKVSKIVNNWVAETVGEMRLVSSIGDITDMTQDDKGRSGLREMHAENGLAYYTWDQDITMERELDKRQADMLAHMIETPRNVGWRRDEMSMAYGLLKQLGHEVTP